MWILWRQCRSRIPQFRWNSKTSNHAKVRLWVDLCWPFPYCFLHRGSLKSVSFMAYCSAAQHDLLQYLSSFIIRRCSLLLKKIEVLLIGLLVRTERKWEFGTFLPTRHACMNVGWRYYTFRTLFTFTNDVTSNKVTPFKHKTIRSRHMTGWARKKEKKKTTRRCAFTLARVASSLAS